VPRRVDRIRHGSAGDGRVPRKGSGVYDLTKYGDGAFSESLRQEVTKRRVCVSLAAIPLCYGPAYQWIKIPEMSIRSKVLRAIGPAPNDQRTFLAFRWPGPPGTHVTPMSNYVIGMGIT
jgi:hypothetical protein